MYNIISYIEIYLLTFARASRFVEPITGYI